MTARDGSSHSSRSNSNSNRHNRQNQSKTILIGVTLLSLVAAVIVSAFWQNAITERMERRQAQALAHQALERLNAHGSRIITFNSHSNETMIDSTDGAAATITTNAKAHVLVNVTSQTKRHWTYSRISPVVTCESTLILVRHCEDLGDPTGTDWADGSKHCSELGYQHAAMLASQFGATTTSSSSSTATRWPRPVRLYGLLPRGARNQRQYETLAPLAEQSNVNVTLLLESGPDGTAAAALVREWFAELRHESSDPEARSVCGQVAVVAWKHAYIPNLAHQLGCGPEQGCPVTAWEDNDFDAAWQLKYVRFSLEHDDRRPLATKQQEKIGDSSSLWHVYGTVTQEGFDPLAFRQHHR